LNEIRNYCRLYRERRKIITRKAAFLSEGNLKGEGRKLLSFINNDYLGLATHPEVIEALQKGANLYGVGSSASNLLGGYYNIHQKLEEELAEFLGYEKVLLFSTGYMANIAVLTTLIGKEDCIFEDRLNHASLIDAARFSRAKCIRYLHNDMEFLNNKLLNNFEGNRWIVSDGVFSMEGDIANIPELCNLAKKFECQLVIDDAHGIGVLGKKGQGSLEHLSLSADDVPILIGTFGKAFGTTGAFVASNSIIIETILQFARGYTCTTSLSPAIANATLASLHLIKQENWRREHLNILIQRFRKGAVALGLPVLNSLTPIQSIILKDVSFAFQITEKLKKQDIWVGCVRPPTVPVDTSRLRINLNVHHTIEDIDCLLEKLENVWQMQRIR
jgi:8-amino-7-oxononanoate synthase